MAPSELTSAALTHIGAAVFLLIIKMKRQIKTIVILGGGLFKDSDGRWRTTLGENQSGHLGILNDRLRVVAGAELWKENKNSQIISSGGQGKLKNILPVGLTSSKVIKDELLKLGVPAKNITEENKSGTTFEQLRAIKKMIEDDKISGNIHIVSNNYHLPRIQAMIEHSDIRAVLSGKINLVGAEDVLLRLLPDQWKEFIEQSKKSEAMKKRVESEKKGVEQIKNGLYKFA